MSLKLLYLIIIISQVNYFYASKIISIPFNSFFKYGQKTNISSIDDLAQTNLYSKINIGEPSHEIKTFLSMHHSFFSITQNHLSKRINDFNTHYDMKKSISFKNVSSNVRNLKDTKYDSIAKEKIELNVYNSEKNDYYNISVDDMIFIYNDNNNKNNNLANLYYLNIGFQIINQKKYKERENFNFINQLKKRNIIENYDWCIFFKKGKNHDGSFLYNPDELINAKGELLIGDLPNNYNPDFQNKQLLSTYSIYSNQLFKWSLEFSNVYYNKSINETKKIDISNIQLNINNYIILAPMSYYYNIKNDFFNYYLTKKMCKIYEGTEYKTFYCEKSENFTIEELKKFPTLYMEHKEFQYTFEFTYEDLFIEKNDKYWFLIALSTFYNDLEEWSMGIIFLRKYNLIFNQDSKTISFYNPNIPISKKEIETKNINKKKIISYFNIITIPIIIIICVILFIIIIKLFFFKIFKINKDKKRLNHLYDNTDYIYHKNYNISEKNNKSNQVLLEMKINI